MATVCKTRGEVLDCLRRNVALQLDASMAELNLNSVFEWCGVVES